MGGGRALGEHILPAPPQINPRAPQEGGEQEEKGPKGSVL